MIVLVIALYLLGKIVPFAYDIKGVENGNISYYRANTALNEALLSMSGNDPAYETASAPSLYTNGSGIIYTVTAKGTTLPRPGLGNSEYDTNWSILAPGRPIQLVLSNAINWTTGTEFYFRVPDLDWNGIQNETLTGTTTIPIINWILSASGGSLIASGSYSTTGVYLWGSQVTAGTASSGTVVFDGRAWRTLTGSADNFESFYTANCSITPQKCTLKLSLVNPLLLTDNVTIAPYLEYQAHFNTPTPLQTAVIETQGYAGGFRKNITRFIQQMTTNEALDFTVFQ